MTYFRTEIPGAHQVRVVNPQGIVAPDGSAVMVLGSDVPGFTGRFAAGDAHRAAQSNAIGTGKVLRFQGRIRGPEEAPPALSELEVYGLVDGEKLIVELNDSGVEQTIDFLTGDFVDIGNATALEVRAKINSVLVGGVCELTGTGGLAIRSNKRGRRARVRIVTSPFALDFVENAWFAVLYVGGTEHAKVEIRAGETRDLNDLAASLAVGGFVEFRFALELRSVP